MLFNIPYHPAFPLYPLLCLYSIGSQRTITSYSILN